MNYYIADTHFGHANILNLCNRPFNSIEEMDETLIKNWNDTVSNQDDIYILGDFSFKSKNPAEYLKKLNGKKHLIIGNHDNKLIKNKECYKYFEEMEDIKVVNDNGLQIFCCHYPLVEWLGYYRNVIHFYGHVHNSFNNTTTCYAANMKNAYNVGADILNFTPKTAKEIIEMPKINRLYNI